MNTKLLDLAATTLKRAKKAGATDCAVTISSLRGVEIGYRDRKPETIKEASTLSLEIRLYVAGRYSAQVTSDLRPRALATFIADAVAMTRLLAEDPFRTLPDPSLYTPRPEVDLALVDPAYATLTPADRHAAARAAEDACLERGGDRVVSASASVRDYHSEAVMLTSNGFVGAEEATTFVTSVQMTANDGDRRPMGASYAAGARRAALPSPEAVGREAAERSLALLGGRKIKTETLPIVVENRSVGRLLANLLQPMTGRLVQQKQSFLADKRGQKIGSDFLTLLDDPLLPGGAGSRLFDDDGLAAKRRVMVEGGILKEFYVDWYYSRKLGWPPTTGSPSNCIIPPGTRSLAAILKELGRGILITDFIGGNANTTTGDASIGIVGQLFVDGEIVHPVAEMNIAGNTLEFWSKLTEAANDPWPYSRLRTPSLVFRDVVVSGA